MVIKIKHFEITFKQFRESHFELMHQWFNRPHVQEFYSLKNWTMDEVRQKLMPHIRCESGVEPFIIHYDGEPIGYIQCYAVKDHPWDNQDLPEKVVENSCGFDLFIGQENYLKKEIGMKIVSQFLDQHIWPKYSYCLADPDVRNQASIRLFEKAGFKRHKQISTKNALKEPVTLCLYLLDRESV